MEVVELQPVSLEEKPALWELLQEYLGAEPFEGSEQFQDEHGAWKYPHFDSYWEAPTRHPYFINVGGKRAGFVLVRELIPGELCSVAEFYVFREHWRKGVGTSAMKLVESLFPYPKWKISYLHHNLRADGFWKHWTTLSSSVIELEVVRPLEPK